MIVPLSLLLARARRRKKIIPSFAVSTPEIVAAVIEAAEKREESAILTIDYQAPHLLPPDALLHLIQDLAAGSRAQIAIHARIPSSREAVEAAASGGVPAFSLHGEGPRHEHHDLTEWAVKETKDLGCEVIGTIRGPSTPERLALFLERTHVPALLLDIEVRVGDQFTPSLPYLKEIARAAKIPLIAEEAHLTGQMVRACAALGLASITVSRHLDAAYTAGLRTGLRDRSSAEPYRYQRIAKHAAYHAALSYLPLT